VGSKAGYSHDDPETAIVGEPSARASAGSPPAVGSSAVASPAIVVSAQARARIW
jgi:hypothetical protein